MSGKGDAPRRVSGDRYRANYDAIFAPPYPAWICRPCGQTHGRGMPAGHVATYHEDTCGICGQVTSCTEPRDFRHLPHWPLKKPLASSADICQHMPTDQPPAATQPHHLGDQ